MVDEFPLQVSNSNWVAVEGNWGGDEGRKGRDRKKVKEMYIAEGFFTLS